VRAICALDSRFSQMPWTTRSAAGAYPDFPVRRLSKRVDRRRRSSEERAKRAILASGEDRQSTGSIQIMPIIALTAGSFLCQGIRPA